MSVLVVHYHPVPHSFSAAVCGRVVRGLRGAGNDLVVAPLHDGADPGEAELVAADQLVLVYPTWWGGQPAALLGWLQRRLGPWIEGRVPRSSSPLRNVARLTAVTTHGSSKLVNVMQGEPGKHLLSRSVAPLCRPRTRLRWRPLYKIDRSTAAERTAFLDRVEAEAATRI